MWKKFATGITFIKLKREKEAIPYGKSSLVKNENSFSPCAQRYGRAPGGPHKGWKCLQRDSGNLPLSGGCRNLTFLLCHINPQLRLSRFWEKGLDSEVQRLSVFSLSFGEYILPLSLCEYMWTVTMVLIFLKHLCASERKWTIFHDCPNSNKRVTSQHGKDLENGGGKRKATLRQLHFWGRIS